MHMFVLLAMYAQQHVVIMYSGFIGLDTMYYLFLCHVFSLDIDVSCITFLCNLLCP